MDRQGPPNRPRYQLARGLTRIRHEKDAMTSIGKQEMEYDAPPGEHWLFLNDGVRDKVVLATIKLCFIMLSELYPYFVLAV